MASMPSWVVWGVSSPVAMAYVYYGVMKLRRGSIRLVASLPLIAFYVYAGKGFATVFERGVYSFFFIWLTAFKIVLLCWDDGPAADAWAVSSFPRFLAVMNLSLQIKRQKFAERFKKTITRKQSRVEQFEGSNGSVVVAQDRGSSAATRFNGLPSSGSSAGVNGTPHQTSSLEISGVNDSKKLGWIVLLKWVDASQDAHMVVLRLLFKFVFLMLITYSYTYRDSMHLGLLSVVYSFDIYVACSLMFEGIAAVVSLMMGIELEAAFNKPFLAHSLADFWGKRWNLLVSNLLRVSIYDPMLQFLLHRSRSDLSKTSKRLGLHEQSQENMTSAAPNASHLPVWARSVSMFSCFLASGLMHELIFYNMTRSKPTWEVTFFFILNGAATLLEGALRRKTSLRLPEYVSTPLTLSFVLVTAIWFFYPPLVDSGAADNAIAEFTYFFQSLNQLVRGS